MTITEFDMRIARDVVRNHKSFIGPAGQYAPSGLTQTHENIAIAIAEGIATYRSIVAKYNEDQ